VFEWHGCLGLYDRNYGSVEFANGVIRLLFTFENKREAFQGIEEELIPVSWDSRRYLIPPEYMIEFCNDVNAGWEPRERLHGNYLLRVGDEKTEVSGFPTVPYEYRSYLITRPIEVEIITVGTSRTHSGIFRFKETQVTLNAGETQGLLVGMELYVFEPDRIAESVEVVKVWDETSEGIMTQTLIGETAPQVGWKLSTRLSWKREKKGDGSQADTADTK
jgi:hypothetical protein